MPIYEFVCKNLSCANYNKVVEEFVPMNHIPDCNYCKDIMTKIMSVSYCRLYGEGFYKPNKKD